MSSKQFFIWVLSLEKSLNFSIVDLGLADFDLRVRVIGLFVSGGRTASLSGEELWRGCLFERLSGIVRSSSALRFEA